MRLSRSTVSMLPETVARPLMTSASPLRIVHLGIGAFHRAHQAVYTQEAGGGWRITGVSLRSPQVRDALVPQDGLYTLTERFNGRTEIRLLTVIDTVLVAQEDPEAVIAALADRDTHVVTLTVTEKGYYRLPDSGTLNHDDPAVAGDLRGDTPQSIYGFLAQALARRRAACTPALTIVSCDNLPGNGALLLRLLNQFLETVDPDLANWARGHIAAPDTMVDRIVPTCTVTDRTAVQAKLGMKDAAAVISEPFRQWVIADHFAGARPNWEEGGAQIVPDVAPFEMAKLRLLNASHSTLAYIGIQLGYAHVHEAVADPLLREFILRQMRREAVPCLSRAPDLDPETYIEAIIERFGNTDLHHRLDQIAMDGSQKLPQRWMATIETRLNHGLESPCHLASVAAWFVYTSAEYTAEDPLRDRYRQIWKTTGGDPVLVVERFMADLNIFSERVRRSPVCVAGLIHALTLWQESGPSALLAKAGV